MNIMLLIIAFNFAMVTIKAEYYGSIDLTNLPEHSLPDEELFNSQVKYGHRLPTDEQITSTYYGNDNTKVKLQSSNHSANDRQLEAENSEHREYQNIRSGNRVRHTDYETHQPSILKNQIRNTRLDKPLSSDPSEGKGFGHVKPNDKELKLGGNNQEYVHQKNVRMRPLKRSNPGLDFRRNTKKSNDHFRSDPYQDKLKNIKGQPRVTFDDDDLRRIPSVRNQDENLISLGPSWLPNFDRKMKKNDDGFKDERHYFDYDIVSGQSDQYFTPSAFWFVTDDDDGLNFQLEQDHKRGGRSGLMFMITEE